MRIEPFGLTMKRLMMGLREISSIPFRYDTVSELVDHDGWDLCGTAKFNGIATITIRRGMPQQETLETIAHELAHLYDVQESGFVHDENNMHSRTFGKHYKTQLRVVAKMHKLVDLLPARLDRSKEYRTWRKMLSSGCDVCERWRKFMPFYFDMGQQRSRRLWRRSPDSEFCKRNCYWRSKPLKWYERKTP